MSGTTMPVKPLRLYLNGMKHVFVLILRSLLSLLLIDLRQFTVIFETFHIA